MRTISRRLEKLERRCAFLLATEDESGVARLRANLRNLEKRVGEPVVAQLEKFLDEAGAEAFYRELIRAELIAHGHVQGPKESLAETCCRAMGIRPGELEARLERGQFGLGFLSGSRQPEVVSDND